MFLDFVLFQNVGTKLIEINPISLWSEIDQTPEISDLSSDFALERNRPKF
jgi:hypothetical protein